MENKTLNIFTIDFPYGNGEPFLKNEIDILAKKFDRIYIFPMNFNNTIIKYELPENITIKHQNIFYPYNRLSILCKNIFFISNIFISEILKTNYKKIYISNFTKHLNVLLHRINAANKLSHLFQDKNNLVYTYWFTQWTMIFSIINSKQKNISLFTRIHGMDVYEDQHTEKDFFFPFRYFQSKQIKKVISISENGMKHLLNTSPYFVNKLMVNRLGVLNFGINPSEKTKEFILVSCSSFQKYKRVHLIVQILQKLDLKIKWIHFGEGEERALVESEVKKLKNNISFELRGHISSKEIMDFYINNRVDLFINVSETEGIPVSIMEAMSFGIPCIATNVGGVSEIVNTKNGFLVEKDLKTETVASLINNYSKLDNAKTEAFRKAAFKTWEEKFNQQKNGNDLTTILFNEN